MSRRRAALRCAALAALTAAALSACGERTGGWVARGPVGGSPSAAAPTAPGAVRLTPLPGGPGTSAGTTAGSTDAPYPPPPAAPTAQGGTGGDGTTAPRPAPSQSSGAPTASPPPTTASPTPTPPALSISATSTGPAGPRWCQRVTARVTNSGGRTAESATVRFATEVVSDLLGFSWWTYTTDQPLAAPVPGHRTVSQSWTVCLAQWQVPLGTHPATRVSGVSNITALRPASHGS